MSKVLGSSAEAIGKTPLVRLDRLTKFHNVKGTILAKLEYLNPGFSKNCLLYTSPSPRDGLLSRMPSSA